MVPPLLLVEEVESMLSAMRLGDDGDDVDVWWNDGYDDVGTKVNAAAAAVLDIARV